MRKEYQTVLDTIDECAELIRKHSGYPNNTETDPRKAFAYGLCMGSLLWLKRQEQERYNSMTSKKETP